jgi:hypothetical protein
MGEARQTTFATVTAHSRHLCYGSFGEGEMPGIPAASVQEGTHS